MDQNQDKQVGTKIIPRDIQVEMKKSYLGMARGIGPLTKEDKKWMEGKDD